MSSTPFGVPLCPFKGTRSAHQGERHPDMRRVLIAHVGTPHRLAFRRIRDIKMDIKNQSYGDILVLSPVGRIDHATSEDFRDSLGPFVERCKKDGDRLVLDLAGIDYVSSAGLRSFMLANKQVKAQGGVIVIAAMQPVVKEIFEISRFTLIFETFGDVSTAIDSLSLAQPKTRQS